MAASADRDCVSTELLFADDTSTLVLERSRGDTVPASVGWLAGASTAGGAGGGGALATVAGAAFERVPPEAELIPTLPAKPRLMPTLGAAEANLGVFSGLFNAATFWPVVGESLAG